VFTGIVDELGAIKETRPGRLTIAAKVMLEGALVRLVAQHTSEFL